ncbi:unnamed protein product [Rotaria sordida]|uniref:t-SNARE coiled-coil homology domain-containing protein n=1 Tax=Rotaria sordida TaxID=392033 RepID=A0A814C9K9_9BILA|nr:unnamed protein product [Rotaria sordida]CAF0938948.1 unnamed protein product [Rotaria sordida]
MTKDRLPELKANTEKYGDGKDISIINHFTVINMKEAFFIDFFDKVDFLANIIDQITELVNHIEHLHNAMLESPLDSKIRDELEEKMRELRQLGDNVRRYLKEMKQIHEIETHNQQKKIRQRIIEAQLNYLTKRFCDIMDKYYGSVITYREKCRTKVVRQSQIDGIEKNDNEIEELLQNRHSIFYPQVTIDIQQTKQNLNDMEESHLDMMYFEDSIQELHDMFIGIANIIELHGVRITSIEEYLSEVSDDIVKTQNIILTTKILNHSARKRKICIITIFITISIICIVFLIQSIL